MSEWRAVQRYEQQSGAWVDVEWSDLSPGDKVRYTDDPDRVFVTRGEVEPNENGIPGNYAVRVKEADPCP